jgi:hypothetical protein
MSINNNIIPSNTVGVFRPMTANIARPSTSSFRNTKGKIETLSD